MKNIFKGILMAAAVAVFGSMTSCLDDAHDDLLGIYAPPTDLTITSAQNVDMVKDGNLRTFTVAFSTQEGVSVNMKLVGNKYFLPSTTYTKAVGAAKNGNYTEGSTVNGSEVVDGGLVVIADGDNYTIGNSVLFTADGKAYRMSGKATLVYEPDPEPIRMSKVLSVNAANPGQLTINLGTDGLVSTPNMYGGADITGEGTYLALDIYSPDGKLYPGTYAASAQGGQIGEGQYGIGWDPGDLWGIGMVFENWGTCLWSVENSEASAQKIVAGDITVELKGNTYTISYIEPGKSERDAIWFEFKGVIEDVVPGAGGEVEPDYIELTKVLSATDNNANGTKSVTLNLGSDGVEATPNAWGGMDYTGDGNYLAIDLYSTDGKINAGTYKPADANAMSEYTYGMGWNPGDLWGIGMVFENWGTCWWTVDEGQTSAVHIEDGDINVAVDGDIITITYNHNGLTFRFRGEIPGFGGIAGGGETPGTPDVDFIEISNFLSAAVNNGTTLSLQLATDGITASQGAWSVELSGDGNYLKIDLYTSDGTLQEGTYTPAANDALAEGNFAMGYDPGDIWGMGIEFKNWGTAWMTRDGGNETGENITDGTITVEKSGDNYIISLQSSVVNVRYTGPVSL